MLVANDWALSIHGMQSRLIKSMTSSVVHGVGEILWEAIITNAPDCLIAPAWIAPSAPAWQASHVVKLGFRTS